MSVLPSSPWTDPRTDPLDINRADTVAEVAAVFRRYETALAAGDVGTLNELFWHSPRSVRFGIADRQQGIAEITAWRREHPDVPPGRRLRDTQVLTVNDRAAVVTTVFDYAGAAPDAAAEGRQTQVWVRFPVGWRIVSAHVSEVSVGLPPPRSLPGTGSTIAGEESGA